jgi:tetratricopeptide (TPR) repeat protein
MPGPFDVFISYCRRDDVGPGGRGWVTALKDLLVAGGSTSGGLPLRVFFDTDDIRDWEDWRHRILAALRQSKVLVVCLSPGYFGSEYCRWEWEHFVRRRGQRRARGDGESIQAVRLAPFSVDDLVLPEWFDSVRRGTTRDLSPWVTASPALLTQAGPARDEALRWVEAIKARVQRARRGLALDYGNVRVASEHFVGRRTQLRELHEHVRLGGVGVLTALHGLGGIGKTELAVFYANEYARSFPGGIWWIDAAPHGDLRAAIGSLAEVPGFLAAPLPNGMEVAQRFAQVMDVLRTCSRKAREADPDEDGQVLLVLDNVELPALFGANQRVHIAKHAWLSILVSTRQVVEATEHAERLQVYPLDALDPEDALALLREWQPGCAFRDAEDDAAARALVRDLGGFTLAVEQAAAYLGANPALSIARFYAELQRQGLQALDQLHDDPAVQGVRLHREGQLKLVLEQTLPPTGSLERVLLDYAACFGPDAVPVPWIEALAREHFPEAVSLELARFGADPTAKAWRWLEQRRLLTPGSCPELRRMHRLVREHIVIGSSPITGEHVETLVARKQSDFEAFWRKSSIPIWISDALADWARQDGPKTHTRARCLGVLANWNLAMRGPLLAHGYALDSYAIHEQLANADPENPVACRAVSVSLDGIGQILEAQGNVDGALAAYERSLSICKSIPPGLDEARFLRDLINCHCNIGRIHLGIGQFRDALAAFNFMLAVARALLLKDKNCLSARRELAVSLGFVGKALLRGDEIEAARDHFEEGLMIADALASHEPENLLARRDLTVFLNDIGDVMVRLNDQRAALEAYQRMLEINRDRAISNPGSMEVQRDVSVGLINVGRMKASLGNLAGALENAREALQIREGLARVDSTNISALRDVVVSRELLWQIETDASAKIDHAQAICRMFEHLENRRAAISQDERRGWNRFSHWLKWTRESNN